MSQVFFGEDAKKDGAKRVIVTAFADNVAQSIQENLTGIEAVTFDFNSDNLIKVLKDKKVNSETIDLVFARYCIGFCKDLNTFFDEVKNTLVDKGYFYISFSPASRAVCARWMFDDYTYLKQYTQKFVEQIAENSGFTLHSTWNDGSEEWDKNLLLPFKMLSRLYLKNDFFKGNNPYERKQHNICMLFQKC